jgi:hypothetical protein
VIGFRTESLTPQGFLYANAHKTGFVLDGTDPIDAHSATGGEMPPGKKPSNADLPQDLHRAQRARYKVTVGVDVPAGTV